MPKSTITSSNIFEVTEYIFEVTEVTEYIFEVTEYKYFKRKRSVLRTPPPQKKNQPVDICDLPQE